MGWSTRPDLRVRMLVCCGRVGCLTVGRFVVWRGPVGGAAWAGWQHAPKTGDQQFSPILWRPRFSPIRAILSLCRGRRPGLVPTRVPPGGAYPRPAISNFPRSYGGLTSRPSEQFSAFAEGVTPASSPPGYTKAPASRPGLIGQTQACSARGAAAATALMRSGRKPDQ